MISEILTTNQFLLFWTFCLLWKWLLVELMSHLHFKVIVWRKYNLTLKIYYHYHLLKKKMVNSNSVHQLLSFSSIHVIINRKNSWSVFFVKKKKKTQRLWEKSYFCFSFFLNDLSSIYMRQTSPEAA